MATFTIIDARNIDQLAGKTGGDVYNVNGGYLTIDQDSRYGANQNTSATLGNTTISNTSGGTIHIDARNVKYIQYTSGSGNVPIQNTIISQTNGASGKLIGVWASLSAAPTLSATTMPATGLVKIKQWSGISYGIGALSGITATASGPQSAGWIEIGWG